MIARLSNLFTRILMRQVARLRNNFYLYLAAVFTLGIALDASVFHVGENLRQKAFDTMVKHRIKLPPADPDIVIVDVNEASLAALAPEYGRYPWPRQVFAEFIEHLETQHPKAVVFDILFADADVYNPDSDAYFNEVISGTNNTFFPVLRLPTAQDKLSQVKPGMIAGVTPLANAQMDATLAVTLPHFEAALKPGRLGTHNIYPDADGIAREYRLFHNDYGWKLPSLPLVVSQALDNPVLQEQSMLLNWRGEPFTYHYVSFSDVFQDMAAKTPRRPANEFTGKVVIIGSTAPSLFDLKATPMARIFPGVEILATAIDNLKHNDPLRVWRGATPYVLLALLLVWVTAGAFFRNVERERFDTIFGFSQLGLLAVSYIGLNISNLYLDLTGPVTWAVAYFSIAKIYALATERAMQRELSFSPTNNTADTDVALMLILLETRFPLTDANLKNLAKSLETMTGIPRKVEFLKGTQTGIWGLFGDMLLVTWKTSPAQVEADALKLADALPAIIKRQRFAIEATRHTLLQSQLGHAQDTASQWRTLFAQAIYQLEQQQVAQAPSPAPHQQKGTP